jgi:hypothetical protein
MLKSEYPLESFVFKPTTTKDSIYMMESTPSDMRKFDMWPIGLMLFKAIFGASFYESVIESHPNKKATSDER